MSRFIQGWFQTTYCPEKVSVDHETGVKQQEFNMFVLDDFPPENFPVDVRKGYVKNYIG